MTTTPQLAEGESFVGGRSEQTAKRLLGLAEKADLAGSVRTTSHGYIVPSSILSDEAPETAIIGGSTAEDDDVELFDPSAASIAEVKEHLAGADQTERERVLAAEAAGEKPRKGVLDLATTEGDK